MPFLIQNSGVECAPPQRSQDGAGTVEFRTRLFVIPKKGQENERDENALQGGREAESENTETRIKSRGRDAVINKPYRPLGSITSLLRLEVAKVGETSKPDDQKAIGLSAEHSRQVRSTNQENSQDGKESQIGAAVKVNPSDLELGNKLWRMRHSNARDDMGLGRYSGLKKFLKSSNRQVKAVKAGGSIFGHLERRGPVECALWASNRIQNIKNRQQKEHGEEDIVSAPAQSQDDPNASDSGHGVRHSAPASSSRTAAGHHTKFAERLRKELDLLDNTSSKARNVGFSDISRQASHAHRKEDAPSVTERRIAQENLPCECEKEQGWHFSSDDLGEAADQDSASLQLNQTQSKRPGPASEKRTPHRPTGKAGRQGCGRDYQDEACHSAAEALKELQSAADTVGSAVEFQQGRQEQGALVLATESQSSREEAHRNHSAGVIVLSEKQRKRLPSYVISFSRKIVEPHSELQPPQEHKEHKEQQHQQQHHQKQQQKQQQQQTRQHQQQRQEHDQVRNDEYDCEEQADQQQRHVNRVLQKAGRNHRAAGGQSGHSPAFAEGSTCLARVQDITSKSKELSSCVVRRSAQFLDCKSKLGASLKDSIDEAEFNRGSALRRKILAIEASLAGNPRKSGTAKQLARIRETANELRDAQHDINLDSSVWFKSLLNKAKELGRLGVAEEKFLAALHQLVVEGYVLTVHLFEAILTSALSDEDHKSPGLQKLAGHVRDNVLKMDLEEHLAFLRDNKLFIPKSLSNSVAEIESKRAAAARSAPSIVAGLRAAAVAAKWKRRSVNLKR